MDLIREEGGEGGETRGGDGMEGGEPSKITPVRTVGGHPYHRILIAKIFASEKQRAIRKNNVISSETFFCCGGRGDEEDIPRTKPE